MKRNKRSTRAMRNKSNAASGTGRGSSRYAIKRGGNMMYGPGCGPGKRAPAAARA